MDTISHGLWAVIFVRAIFNKGKLGLAFLAGILPDIITFGLIFVQVFLFRMKPPVADPPSFIAPQYLSVLYGITHSIIIAIIVFLVIYLIKKKVYVWLLGWPLHILVDIPTHSKGFFPTPFLYPISNYTVNGIGWGNPYIFFTNWALIGFFFILMYRKKLHEVIKRFLKKSFKHR